MAFVYLDTSLGVNGDGSIGSPYNTMAGHTWAQGDVVHIKAGTTVLETITPTQNGITFVRYGDGPKPIIDMENTRANGINLNTRTGCIVHGIKFANQDAAPPNAGIRVTGSAHIIRQCAFENCRIAMHLNNSPDNLVVYNDFDIGNANTLGIAYAVRMNGASTAGNVIMWNTIAHSVDLDYGTMFEIYGAENNIVTHNIMTARACDGMLMREGATGNLFAFNAIYGNTKDCIAIESANGNIIRNNSVNQYGGMGSTFPCMKLGDDFGAGTPSDLNEIYDNIFVSTNAYPIVLSNAGTGNIFDGNRVYKSLDPDGDYVRYDVGGLSNNFLTFAEWQAEGYDANGDNSIVELTDNCIPLRPSNLLHASNNGIKMYLNRLHGRNTVGAYGFEN